MKKHITFIIFIFYIFTVHGQTFEVAKRISVPGNGGWDYLAVNESSQQLFVSHGTVVNVIDIQSGTTIATIQDTKGVHGIAVANDINKAFISDGADNSVTIINLDSFSLIEKVKIQGEKPDAILYDSFSKKVFVFNAKSNDAAVLDANSNKVIATIPLKGKPEFSVTDGKGHIFVNIEDTNQIKMIDVKTLKVKKAFSIAPGESPSGLAIDTAGNRLFSVCENKMLIITDSMTGRNIAAVPIGEGCDGVVFNSIKKLIFSSNGEGTITVIKQKSKDEYAVIQTVTTQKGARTITLNKTTGALYVPTCSFGPSLAATAENPDPRPVALPNSFTVLVVEQL